MDEEAVSIWSYGEEEEERLLRSQPLCGDQHPILGRTATDQQAAAGLRAEV